jgi:replication-associated recombination protein RarA
MEVAQTNIALYDKNGEQHYDIVSAFIWKGKYGY